jgi:hypothetical protein
LVGIDVSTRKLLIAMRRFREHGVTPEAALLEEASW